MKPEAIQVDPQQRVDRVVFAGVSFGQFCLPGIRECEPGRIKFDAWWHFSWSRQSHDPVQLARHARLQDTPAPSEL